MRRAMKMGAVIAGILVLLAGFGIWRNVLSSPKSEAHASQWMGVNAVIVLSTWTAFM